MGLQHWLQLALTDGIGPVLQMRLIEACGGDVAAACTANATTLRNVDGIGSSKSSKIAESLKRSADQVQAELAKARDAGVLLTCIEDESYPALLREIPDPPAVLYVRGKFEPRDLNAVAIVGSRKCSFYGREQAERFGALLAGAAITVISGGARGIDSAAHRGALSHERGRTIAVLGSGVDVAYPPENAALFDQIAQRGAVVSEYPLGTPPIAENFPRRNRIVSGMTRGVLVIEADERSGALITARQACDDHGRPVFAIPGRVDNKLSIGPHQLIRDGATLVTGLEDILEGLGPLPHSAVVETNLFSISSAAEVAASATPQAADRAEPIGLSDRQRAILLHLDEPLDVDAIIERTTLPAHQVLQELTFLSLRGLVRREGQHYARRS
ncbi:MAG: DNA-protecting protein DprA [Anaerolineae bacterium]|nr:DNA-protecting protein DprA [Phycisphaerae bacterium]